MLFHGRGLPTGECLHGRRSSRQKVAGVRGAAVSSQQEVASRGLQGRRVLATAVSIQFTEYWQEVAGVRDAVVSSRQEVASR